MIRKNEIVELDKKGHISPKTLLRLFTEMWELQERMAGTRSKLSQHIMQDGARAGRVETQMQDLANFLGERIERLEGRVNFIEKFTPADFRLPPKTCGTCRFKIGTAEGFRGCYRKEDGRRYTPVYLDMPACPKHEEAE